MASRVIRSREQRIADAKKEVEKLEQGTKDQAIRLKAQAQTWIERSADLVVKADSASVKADELLFSLGIEPDKFWEEQDNNTKDGE